jgi:hypothetical protein
VKKNKFDKYSRTDMVRAFTEEEHRDRRDRMVVGFITTYAIRAHHH